jgi:hypothetical protein
MRAIMARSPFGVPPVAVRLLERPDNEKAGHDVKDDGAHEARIRLEECRQPGAEDRVVATSEHYLGLGQYAVADPRLEGLLLDDIDGASESIREQILHPHQIEQVECRGWIDVDEYVDVAVGPRVATHDRSEHSRRRDAALPQLRLERLQRRDDLALFRGWRRPRWRNRRREQKPPR